LAPGRYIAAVSGGVDSMVLLDLLSNLPKVEIIVAHFDHGIRPDSRKDESFVKGATDKYGFAFESARASLGPAASEETARHARYDFLNGLRTKYRATAVITAHHQDDLIETALINLLRGTGRRGLYAISANSKVTRPLLGYPKQEIKDFAENRGIEWREDPTNADENYLRNYVRVNLVPKLTVAQRRQIISDLDKVAKIDGVIQQELQDMEAELISDGELVRSRFAALPPEVGNEILLRHFRALGVADIDRRTINRINAGIRTGGHNRTIPVKDGLRLKLTSKTARFDR